MKKIEKLTIDDILSDKALGAVKEFYFDSAELGKRIDFEKLPSNKIMEVMADVQENVITMYEANLYLIYLSVPMFRNAKLQEKYEIKDNPYKVVEAIFRGNLLDINEFGVKILNNYGFTQDRLDNVKK